MDKATEHIVTIDMMGRRGSRDSLARWYHEIDASVRSLAVVVADILSKDLLEVAAAKNEHPVEAFCPDGSHPALGAGIGPR